MATFERTDEGVEAMVNGDGEEVDVFASAAAGRIALYVHGSFLLGPTHSGIRLTPAEARALRRTLTKVIREVEGQGSDV